jgi:MFS transporter, FHS family, glucose/mannose:H+ symporter
LIRADDRVLLSRPALGGIGLSFFLIGALAAAYGPLLGILGHRFGISLSVAGGVLSAHFAGAVIGVIVSMRAMERVPERLFVSCALGCIGLGCVGVVLAPSWPAFLAAVSVIGLGYGALDIGLNQLVAHSQGRRRSALLNALNGAYGVGAVTSPILISRVGERQLSFLYAGAAVMVLGILPTLGISGRLPVTTEKPPARPGVLVGIFAFAFLLYVGMESGVSGWMTSHLESTGLGFAVASAVTSGFWLALAAGRLLVALVPARVPVPVIVLAGSGVAAVALLSAMIGPAAPLAYVVTGLAFAPIFPTGIVWLARLRPGDSRATSWLFPAAMLGGALVPAAVGVVIGLIGIRYAPAILSLVALACLLAFSLAGRFMSWPKAEATTQTAQ